MTAGIAEKIDRYIESLPDADGDSFYGSYQSLAEMFLKGSGLSYTGWTPKEIAPGVPSFSLWLEQEARAEQLQPRMEGI